MILLQRLACSVGETDCPVFLTSHVRGVALVQALSDLEATGDKRDFIRAVVVGPADAEESRVVSLAAVSCVLGLEQWSPVPGSSLRSPRRMICSRSQTGTLLSCFPISVGDRWLRELEIPHPSRMPPVSRSRYRAGRLDD